MIAVQFPAYSVSLCARAIALVNAMTVGMDVIAGTMTVTVTVTAAVGMKETETGVGGSVYGHRSVRVCVRVRVACACACCQRNLSTTHIHVAPHLRTSTHRRTVSPSLLHALAHGMTATTTTSTSTTCIPTLVLSPIFLFGLAYVAMHKTKSLQ